MGANSGSRASHSDPKGSSPSGFDPERGCATCSGEYPMYGVAPHECYWRKGPGFTLGQSTLLTSDTWGQALFVPDLLEGEDWSDFRYPCATGVFFCPECCPDQYAESWRLLVGRIGEPPLELEAAHEH